MDEMLSAYLEKDEHVLWDGHPEAFETLDKTHRQPFNQKLLITLLTASILLVLYIFVIGGREPLIIAVTAIIAAYICVSTHMNAWHMKKVRYLITDRRIIVMSNDITSAYYNEIPLAFFRKDADGHTSLVCGESAAELAPCKWRSHSAAGVRFIPNTGICDNLILYAIPDLDRVKEVLKPYLTVN